MNNLIHTYILKEILWCNGKWLSELLNYRNVAPRVCTISIYSLVFSTVVLYSDHLTSLYCLLLCVCTYPVLADAVWNPSQEPDSSVSDHRSRGRQLSGRGKMPGEELVFFIVCPIEFLYSIRRAHVELCSFYLSPLCNSLSISSLPLLLVFPLAPSLPAFPSHSLPTSPYFHCSLLLSCCLPPSLPLSPPSLPYRVTGQTGWQALQLMLSC